MIQSCANYCTITNAIVAAFKDLDGKQSYMANIFKTMRELWHYLATLYKSLFNIQGHLMDPIEDAFLKRRK
jgi:hypothetical protein